MAFRTLNLTMTGAAQQVTTTRTPILWVKFESVTGNADVLVGNSNITATIYGFIVEDGPTADKEVGPFSQGAPMDLTEFYVIGTNTQILHVSYVAY